MKLATFVSLVAIVLGLGICQDLQAQTTPARYELQFVPVSTSGSSLDVKVQIRSVGADFQLFNANLVFTVSPASNFGTAVLLTRFENFDNTVSSHYKALTLSHPPAGKYSLNILQGEAPYTTVSSTWLDVAVVRFPVTNASGAYSFAWVNPSASAVSGACTGVFQYTGDNLRPAAVGGTGTSLNGSLTQLALVAFTARISGKQVLLNWATSPESKIKSFGVERSGASSSWTSIGSVDGANGAQTYAFSDKDIAGASVLSYRLKMMDDAGQAKYSSEAKVQFASISVKPQLLASYPNPFNPAVTIHFTIPTDMTVTVSVFDAAGKEVARLYDAELLQTGDYSKVFNGTELASGKYLLRLVAGDYVATENLILNK